MKLKGISASEDFKSRYAAMAQDPTKNNIGAMMLRLIAHLEAEEDDIQQLVCRQADDLVFTNIDTPLGGKKVYVGVKEYFYSLETASYEIMYYLPLPWFSVTGYTSDVVTAAQMIHEAIERTVERND